MIRTTTLSLLLLCLLSMGLSATASAEQDIPRWDIATPAPQWQLALAVGWGEKSNPLRDYDDIPVYVLPSIAWYGERFFFDNGTFGYTLSDSLDYSINLISAFNDDAGWFNRWDPSNLFIGGLSGGSPAPRVSLSPYSRDPEPQYHLNRRHLTYMAGGEIVWYTSLGNWRAQLTQDMFAVHQGQQATFAWFNHWQLKGFNLNLALTLDWKSRKLVDYYYGIRPDEASWGSPLYSGRSSVNPGIELDLSYPLTNKLELLLLGRYTRFGAGIADSPLLMEDHSVGVFIGTAYRF
ncbi:MipA/OmpV family protein [Shewanella sp. GXUN23E]|uniref:MipA/OmpV family protein n=1 Tax=Shewanella sp. GXUN23E TaxID=3422498 RepID=UPI003D7CDF75